jgi:hypothetical protein
MVSGLDLGLAAPIIACTSCQIVYPLEMRRASPCREKEFE